MGAADDNVSRYQEGVEAGKRRDLDGLLALYHEQAGVTDHAVQQTMSGHEELRAYFQQQFFDFSSDQTFDIADIIAAGDWTIARLIGRGTHDGSWEGLEATGKRFELEGCDLVRWEDGKIVEEHVYYDLYSLLAQLGQVPPLTETA